MNYKNEINQFLSYDVLGLKKVLIVVILFPILFTVIRNSNRIGPEFFSEPVVIINYLGTLGISFILLFSTLLRNHLVKRLIFPNIDATKPKLEKSLAYLQKTEKVTKTKFDNSYNSKKTAALNHLQLIKLFRERIENAMKSDNSN